MNEPTTTITLSLISHTNVGKTTLARTLLRRDVGEVRDRPHVTEVNEAYTLLEHDGAVLRLWDTPGFGDLTRLIQRLRRERTPIGWLLHQLWDRVADRPLFCGQQAAHNVKHDADIVLYLVNAAEDPEHAGYVPPELELLGWIGRPVLLLLNQVGDDAEAELLPRWQSFAARHPIVRDLLPLDAFARCWTHEGVMLERVVPLLPDTQRAAMTTLVGAWNRRNQELFGESCAGIARYLFDAAADRERPAAGGNASGVELIRSIAESLGFSNAPSRHAMQALGERLDRRTVELSNGLIAAHGLEGGSAVEIQNGLDDVRVRGGVPDERISAVLGMVVSGALGGLAADALSGGLSLGGGMIAGGILGALGGSALARGYRLIGGDDPSVSWTPLFLNRLTVQALLRYLAVAHYGRGSGPFADRALPLRWVEAVEREVTARRAELERCWSAAHAGPTDAVAERVTRVTEQILRAVLIEAYPEAGSLLDG